MGDDLRSIFKHGEVGVETRSTLAYCSDMEVKEGWCLQIWCNAN